MSAPEPACSFCNAPLAKVRLMIAGTPINGKTPHICDDCVDLVNEVFTEDAQAISKHIFGSGKGNPNNDICTFCHRDIYYCLGYRDKGLLICLDCLETCKKLITKDGETKREEQQQPQPVLLGHDVDTSNAISLTPADRIRGLYIIGINGTGKTTLIKNLVVHDMQQGSGLCVLDPHGDMTTELLSYVPAHRYSDVRLLDVKQEKTMQPNFAINIFECQNKNNPIDVTRTLTTVMEVFEKIWGSLTNRPQMAQTLRNVTLTLIANPHLTMVDIPTLLTDASFRQSTYQNMTNRQARDFWQRYDNLSYSGQSQWNQSTLNKLDEFLSNPLAYEIVRHRKTSLNFREAMDNRLIVFVRLSAEFSDLTALVGSVLVGNLLRAALSRSDTSHRPVFYLYADEYQRFQTPSFATLLDEARKYAIGTTLAHQRRDQLTYGQREAPLGAASLAIFQVVGPDAVELVKNLNPKPKPVVEQPAPPLPPPDPIAHLLNQPQPEEIRGVCEYLRLASLRKYRTMNENELLTSAYDLDCSAQPESLERGYTKINNYFTQAMYHPDMLATDAEIGHLGDILYSLRGFWGVKNEARRYQVQQYLTTHPTFAIQEYSAPRHLL